MAVKRSFNIVGLLAALALGGCAALGSLVDPGGDLFGSVETEATPSSAAPLVAEGTLENQAPARGGVIADDPRAALAGRDILRRGGNAADAAIAAYFVMAVSYPSQAGLDGNGACLALRPGAQAAEALNFFSSPAPGELAAGSNVAAMEALHARYGGALRWAQLVAPAETLARFGAPVSRALAADLFERATPLMADTDFAALFGSKIGPGPLREGEILVQPRLADTLAAIRLNGAKAFEAGTVAAGLDAAARRTGLERKPPALDPASWWQSPVSLGYRDAVFHTLPPPAIGGIGALNLWHLLTAGGRYAAAAPAEKPHLLAEASIRAFAVRAAGLPAAGEAIATQRLEAAFADYRADAHTPAAALDPKPAPAAENPWGASVVALDGQGLAVTCGFTLNRPFGAGRLAPQSGVVLAAPRADPHDGLALVIMSARGEALFVAAGSGGPETPGAIVAVALDAILEGKPLAAAMRRVRLLASGLPDLVRLEPGFTDSAIAGLRARGHEVETASPLQGRVNAALCRSGAIQAGGMCEFSADVRWFGADFKN